jgi:hypothetical protein
VTRKRENKKDIRKEKYNKETRTNIEKKEKNSVDED